MITDNRTLTVSKSGDVDLAALAAGGLLPPAYSKQFFMRLIEQAVALKEFTVEPMGSYMQDLPAMKFDGWFLAAGQEGTALGYGDTTTPTFTSPRLSAKLFRGLLPITEEALEDNIQRNTLLPYIMSVLPAVAARDIERIVFNSAAAGVAGYPQLSQLDGLFAQATTNPYVGDGAVINKDQLEGMIATLRTEYRQDVSGLAFFTNVKAERTYRHGLAQRNTIAGDRYLIENVPVLVSGIPLKPCAAMDYLTANISKALLGRPKDVHVGFWREIKLKLFEEPKAGKFWIACSLRFDVKYQDEVGWVNGSSILSAAA